MFNSLPKLISVLPMTLYITFISLIIGFAAAVIIAIVREREIPILSQVLGILVSFVRGTPVLVQLYMVYYGLPRLLVYLEQQGVSVKSGSLPPLLIAVFAYSINSAANLSETIRSAYHSVDSGQIRAGLSVGMTPTMTIIRIVIPQLITNLIPNFSNFCLDLIKDTALVYNIGVVEIMAKSNIIASFGFQYLEVYLDALIIYLVTCFVIGKLLQIAEEVANKKVLQA